MCFVDSNRCGRFRNARESRRILQPDEAMTVEHIQTIFSPEHGGPAVSLRNFALGQAARGVEVRVRVLDGFRHTSPALQLGGAIDQQVFPVAFPQVSGRSPALQRFLRTEKSPDIYHLHGVWHLGQRYAAQEAQRRNVPCVVELMGAYQPEELVRKPWRKRLFRAWFQDDLLRRAACIHTNSVRESEQMMQLGFRGPFAPIPVGFDVTAADALEARLGAHVPAFAAEWPADQQFVLYLSRLHPNKGIEILLGAWARIALEHPDVWLVIAGPGQPDYRAALAARAAGLPGGERIRFVGFVSDLDRVWLYRRAAVYCLPSLSQNYGATIQDALGQERRSSRPRAHHGATSKPSGPAGWRNRRSIRWRRSSGWPWRLRPTRAGRWREGPRLDSAGILTRNRD